MKNENYTKEEEELLIKYYEDYGSEHVHNLIGRSKKSIMNKAYRLGLHVKKEVKINNNKISQIKYFNERKNSSFKINVEQFLDITTEEVAYFLGYFWADGYVLESRNEIRFEILNDDLINIKSVLDKIGKWNYSTRKRISVLGSAITSNKKLTQFLLENDYKVKSKESADKILSKIPNNLKYYFFRGLVDGDGNLYINKKKQTVTITSSYEQEWYFLEEICKKLNIKYYVYRKVEKNGKKSFFQINGTNAKKFCDYIYQNRIEDNIGLNRKYEKYLKLIEIIKNSKKTKNNILKKDVINLHKKGFKKCEILKKIKTSKTSICRWIKIFSQE
jgi:hypothetical protein